MRGTAARCRRHHRDLISLSVVSCAWRSNLSIPLKHLPNSGTRTADATVELGSQLSATSPAMGHYAAMAANGAKKQKAGETPSSGLRVPSRLRGRGGDPAQSDRRCPSRTKVRLDPPEGPENPWQPRKCSGSVTSGGPAELVTELESFLQLGARAERQ